MEVMAGLALLATVLVALLQIEARSRRQTAHAERRAQAVKVADALLTEWWQLPQGLPRAGGGVVQSDPSLTWRTTTIDDATVNELSGQIVRLEIFDARSTNVPGEALIHTDVVAPIKLFGANPPP